MTPSEPIKQPDAAKTSAGSGRGRGRPPVHGLVTLKRAVRELGGRVIDGRTTLGKQLAGWRADLMRDLGGDVSTQQAAIVDLAVKTKLMLDSIDVWLLTQPSLVLARKKALLPVVRERTQLSDALARYLGLLGLERKTRELDVVEALAVLHRRSEAAEANPETRRTRDTEGGEREACSLVNGGVERSKDVPTGASSEAAEAIVGALSSARPA